MSTVSTQDPKSDFLTHLVNLNTEQSRKQANFLDIKRQKFSRGALTVVHVIKKEYCHSMETSAHTLLSNSKLISLVWTVNSLFILIYRGLNEKIKP